VSTKHRTDLDGRGNSRRARTAVARSGQADAAPVPAETQNTLALQGALLEHGPEPAMILVILALMGASGTVRIRRSCLDGFDRPQRCPAVQAVVAKYRPRFAGCLDGPKVG
jgi:hypothetical protein